MEKIACIDVGLKRVGLAFSFDGLVMPQKPILRKNRNQASKMLFDILNQWDIQILVVGIPQDSNNFEEMQRRIKHFVDLIGFSGRICFVDEYGTSIEAKTMMRGVTKQKKDGKIDSLAACVILQRYLMREKK